MVSVSGNYFYDIHIEVDCHYELSANNQFKRVYYYKLQTRTDSIIIYLHCFATLYNST